MTDLPFRARAFGQNWAADLPLARFDTLNAGELTTDFQVRSVIELPERDILACRGRNAVHADGFRFSWVNIATFDVYYPGRDINYLPLDGWRGIMPDAFYSTVAAMAAAGAGLLPMHASAVEFNGSAFIFAGPAGAGKSTLTAELLVSGARFLSDDLTIISPPHSDGGFGVTRGRPTIRLHAETAKLIDAENYEDVPDDPRGKLLVQPSIRASDSAFPLAGIFLIGPGAAEVHLSEVLRLMPAQMFRPLWMDTLPGRGQRRAWLIEMAGKVPVRRLPAVADFDPEARRSRIQSTLDAMADWALK